MQNKELLENKKEIAKFMGFPFFFGDYNGNIEEWEIGIDLIVTTEQLDFDSNWNSLMEVVRKCHDLNPYWAIQVFEYSNFLNNDITEVFKSVIQYIKFWKR